MKIRWGMDWRARLWLVARMICTHSRFACCNTVWLEGLFNNERQMQAGSRRESLTYLDLTYILSTPNIQCSSPPRTTVTWVSPVFPHMPALLPCGNSRHLHEGNSHLRYLQYWVGTVIRTEAWKSVFCELATNPYSLVHACWTHKRHQHSTSWVSLSVGKYLGYKHSACLLASVCGSTFLPSLFCIQTTR